MFLGTNIASKLFGGESTGFWLTVLMMLDKLTSKLSESFMLYSGSNVTDTHGLLGCFQNNSHDVVWKTYTAILSYADH